MPRVTPAFQAKSKRKKSKVSKVKVAIVGAGIVLAGAIGMNMLTNTNPASMNSGAPYEEARAEKLDVFHSLTRGMIDDFAANMADVTDASRAGQYRNDIETNLEAMLEEALIHDETEVRAPIQTSIADKNAISIARKQGIKVAFDDQLTEYGAVYHPTEKVVAINANVPIEQAAIYARNALHNISYSVFADAKTVAHWGGAEKRPDGAKLLMETYFAVDKSATERGNVNASITRGNDLPNNFRPPAPPLKAGPGS